MKLIVGLGNPDLKYKNTRHNIGFMALDYYAKEKRYSFKKKKEFKGEVYLSKDFILLKPLTYMNLSGESVQAVSNFYKISPEDILVISDDFNIPFLKLRLRNKGSAGGHNGLKSIISQVGSEDFKRIRVGLGSPEYDTIDFVLSKFSIEDIKQMDVTFEKIKEAIDLFIEDKPFDIIMNKYNTNEPLQWLFFRIS